MRVAEVAVGAVRPNEPSGFRRGHLRTLSNTTYVWFLWTYNNRSRRAFTLSPRPPPPSSPSLTEATFCFSVSGRKAWKCLLAYWPQNLGELKVLVSPSAWLTNTDNQCLPPDTAASVLTSDTDRNWHHRCFITHWLSLGFETARAVIASCGHVSLLTVWSTASVSPGKTCFVVPNMSARRLRMLSTIQVNVRLGHNPLGVTMNGSQP